MYSNLAFAIALLGIFSIFELLKGNQKISLIKYHFIARLIFINQKAITLFFQYPKINPHSNYEGFLKIEKVNFIILYSYIFLPNHHFHY